MSESPASDLPRAYCYRCFKPASVCICASLPRVANRTHVHILQHPRERNRPIGTVRFADLGLQRCAVEVDRPAAGVPSRLAAGPLAGTALLFPSPKARPVESLAPHERPDTLFVLDGTWHQVKALVRNNPWLEALPHLYLATPEPSRYRIRAEPQVHYLSTLEAIVATLAHLEPETPGFEALLHAFDAMIDTQVARSAVRKVRRRPVPKSPRAPYVPPLWTARPAHHVLLHAETVGPGRSARPLQVCAWRLATDERFECLVAHDPVVDARKRAHIGISDAAFATAVDEGELAARWQAFLRPDDVLLAWQQRALDLLAPPERAVQVKAVWCNRTHRPAGHLVDVLAQAGLAPEPAAFLGQAGLQMAGLRALVERLTPRPA